MQELEKILYELEKRIFTAEVYNDDFDGTTITNLICLGDVRDILEKHMNDGWIPVKRLYIQILVSTLHYITTQIRQPYLIW